MLFAHRLELTVTDAPGTLERIVATCRSRQCTVIALQFVAGDRHRPGRVELTLDGPERMARLAAARLAGLLEVTSIRGLDRPSGEGPHAPAAARAAVAGASVPAPQLV